MEEQQYRLIDKNGDEGDFDEGSQLPNRRLVSSASQQVLKYLHIGVDIALIVIIVVLSVLLYKERYVYQRFIEYSPANGVIEPQVVRFSPSLNHTRTPYMGGPSPEVDQAWEELYNAFGNSRLPKSEADKLRIKTLEIPDDPGYYISQLDVFHELHCLNSLRQYMYPEYYNLTNPTGLMIEHRDHCIDTLRQSLMCSADITPISFVWDEEKHMAFGLPASYHQCRNFSKIQEWAKQNQMITPFDRTRHGHGH